MTRIVPPRVIRSFPQPASAGGAKAEARATREESLPAPHISTSQQIGFFGHTQTGENRVVVVLAGEGAPTITGGWVQVAKVKRFQRVAFTVPEGYEPIEMQIPIQFEALLQTKERKDLEQDILNLEWMAGRYPLGAGQSELKGEPPYVEVFTVNAEGQQIPLVPLQYQGEPGASRQWFMGSIAFDANPERDTGGARLRQKATVTLTEIVSTPSSLQRNREAREQVKNKYNTVYSTASENTIRRIAVAYGIPSSWQAIVEANSNISGGERELRIGTAVKIPLSAFRQVPR
jgi:hypothetical protein